VDVVHRLLEHEFEGEFGKATYRQCKRIWSLCILAGIEPVWCKGMPYGKAVNLIAKLEIIRGLKHGNV
jgi:hypothetical protein